MMYAVRSQLVRRSLNEQLGVVAVTVGRDIFLGRSAPDVTSTASERLLAHELSIGSNRAARHCSRVGTHRRISSDVHLGGSSRSPDFDVPQNDVGVLRRTDRGLRVLVDCIVPASVPKT
jgi:Domain of unknown function (DUF4157)